CELLRIPSVSADSGRRDDIRRAADWVAGQFRGLGFATEIIPTAGHPLVYAESPQVEDAPTVLVYGHYDVQPPEPLEKWTSPPFEPTIRDGCVVARGATDDKGQLFTHVKSAEAWIKTEGRLPVNLKYLIEGEEEVGSANLEHFIAANAEKLACDCVVISDSSQLAPGQPAITCGLRGIAYYELVLRGPNRDLHSGTFGGTVANPANALARMLAALIDGRGKIQVPGFYDDVVELSDREREQTAALPFDEEHYREEIGVAALSGEEGYTTLERRWARPTFDLCGLTSGYQGEGAKTVLPAVASAKVSFRLVPNQDPEKITQGLKTLLAEICPPGIEMELLSHHGSPGVLVPQDSPYMQAAARAIEYAFGVRPVFIREGGSIPVVATFADALGVDTLLLGWGQDDDNTHSPNEKFSLADFHRAIKASARLWEEIGKCRG
ncbi:MAG: dipeptidase, partial [Planctomycetia bacterium]|nr:dipeptidase [Planctomycetia bacterium]